MSVAAMSWRARFLAIRSNKMFEMTVISIIILGAGEPGRTMSARAASAILCGNSFSAGWPKQRPGHL